MKRIECRDAVARCVALPDESGDFRQCLITAEPSATLELREMLLVCNLLQLVLRQQTPQMLICCADFQNLRDMQGADVSSTSVMAPRRLGAMEPHATLHIDSTC